MNKKLPIFYDCGRCPAYCCTYPRIEVSEADVRRLARGLGIDAPSVARRFTRLVRGTSTRVLRHRKDAIFGSACRFLHPEERRCTVYGHRPSACRGFPGTPRCGYYDLLASERSRQDDPDLVVVAWVADA